MAAVDFLCGAVGASRGLRERMEEAIQERTEKTIHVYEDGDVFLLSSGEDIDQGRLKVAFNGHLIGTDQPPETHIAALYAEKGKNFPESLTGNFRVAVYDEEEGRLFLATDKAGGRAMYHTQSGDSFAFSSHMSPLFRCDSVTLDVSREGVRDYIRNGTVSCSWGRPLIQGLDQMGGAEILGYGGDSPFSATYWDVKDIDTCSVSDSTAADKLEELLEEAAGRMVEDMDGAPNVFFSGGVDSSFMVSFFKQASDEVNTYTYGYRDETFERAHKVSDELGTDQHDIRVRDEAYSVKDIWETEQPLVFSMFFDAPHYASEVDADHCSMGLTSVVPFPVTLDRIRKLEKLRKVEPALRVAWRAGFYRGANILPDKYRKALDVAASPYNTSIVTNSYTLERRKTEELLENGKSRYGLERRIAEKHDVAEKTYVDAFRYLQFREREGRWGQLMWQFMDHYGLFTYAPLLEFSYSLPMEQVKNRRLLLRIAEKRGVPKHVLDSSPSGPMFPADVITRRLLNDRDEYQRVMDSFLERGFIDRRKGQDVLAPEALDRSNFNAVFFTGGIYMLERWLQAFHDSDEPWQSPV